MANQLKLQVLLAAVDKITRPLKSIQQAAGHTSQEMRDTQARVKELNQATGQIDGYRKVSRQVGITGNELKKLQGHYRELQQQIKSTENPSKSLIRELEQARSKYQQVMKQQRRNIQIQNEHRQRLEDAGISTKKLSGHQQKLADQVADATRALEQQKDKLAEINAQQKKLNAARQQYDKTLEVRGSLATRGATAAAAGAAGLGVFAGQAVSSDMAGAKIAAQLGQQDAGAEYTNIINTVYRTGISDSLEGAANAVSVVTAAFGSLETISAKQLAALTGQAETLARTFDIDVKEATQTAAIMVTNGLAASAGEAFDLMTRGMQNVSASMRNELPEILHEYSTNFRALGFTGAEAMNLLAAQADQGKFALDKTGDALKEFTIRGSDMSKASVAAYEAIGLNAAKMSSAIASGGEPAREALQQTARALLAITDPADRANTAIALFGTPIEDLSVDQIPQFLQALGQIPDQVGQVNGATGKLADTLTNNAGDALRQIQRLISGEMMAVLQGFQEDIIGISKAVTGWAKENPALVSTLAKGAVAVGLLAIAGGTLALTIAGLLGPFAAMRYATQVLGIKALPSLLPMLKAVGAGFIKLGVAMLTTPIGWLIMGIAALAGAGYLIYKNWDAIKAYMAAFWQGVEALAAAGIEMFKTIFGWSPLGLLINNWGQITGWFSTLPEQFRQYGANILDGLLAGITGKLAAVKDKIVGAGKAVAGWFKDTLGIRSPSRVFTQFGDDTMAGLANGLAKNHDPEQQVTATAKRLKAAGAGIALGMAAMPVTAALPPVTDAQRIITEQLQPAGLPPIPDETRTIRERVERAQLPDTSAAVARIQTQQQEQAQSRPAPAAPAPQQHTTVFEPGAIVIHAAPGMDAQELAMLVQRQIEAYERRKVAQSRARLTDLE